MADSGTSSEGRATPALSRAALEACVEAATAAPSLHNSQPWRFRLGDDRVEVFADQSRRLDVIDPSGRELLISVGAALLNLRVAVGSHGRSSVVVLFPEPAEPDLVARVTVGEPEPPSHSLIALAQAVPHRHTNRMPFARQAVPDATLEALEHAAREEGATLAVASSVARAAILALARTAEHRLRAQGEYRAELSRWTRPVHGRRDGVPPQAFGPWDAMEALPLRDFGLSLPKLRRPAERYEPFPLIVVLSSVGDSPTDWVRSGLALERVLLVATAAGLGATPLSQPLEIPALRELVTDSRSGRWAQVILRLGYGPPTVPTTRRALADVLVT